jgi:NADPH:quinone reductase-like Zn-dependent oxidoreductase
MKAIVHRDFGPPEVLRCVEVATPEPADHEVLIRVQAASTNPLDWRMMRGEPRILRLLLGRGDKPVGRDVAGVIEAVGKRVTQFGPGDAVFGTSQGAFAEYTCAPASRLVRMPKQITFEHAASLPIAGLTALQGLRDVGRIRSGQSVLINGAAGGVGSFAIQIAKSFGVQVTGVCSTRNLEFVRSLGADRVIDYTREDFTTGRECYDLILECVGNLSLGACRRVLAARGTCVIVGAPKRLGTIAFRGAGAWLLTRFTSRKFTMFIARSKPEDLTTLSALVETGKLTPVIDRRYDLDQVPEAIRYLEAGHARGKVIITIARTPPA